MSIININKIKKLRNRSQHRSIYIPDTIEINTKTSREQYYEHHSKRIELIKQNELKATKYSLLFYSQV